jgi:hypothetical protein
MAEALWPALQAKLAVADQEDGASSPEVVIRVIDASTLLPPRTVRPHGVPISRTKP